MTDRRLRILAGARTRHWGRCRDCGRNVLWVTSSPKGTMLPFDREPLVLSREQHPETTVRFEVVASEHLHFATCPTRVKQAPTPRRGDDQPRFF